MTCKPLVIIGTSRKNGNTTQVMEKIIGDREATRLNLSDYELEYFDYENGYSNDHFREIAQKMVSSGKVILATPVYWYNVSAQMKTFIDRWSDLFYFHKELYESLQGTEIFVVACYGNTLKNFVSEPIRLTSEYMGMRWGGKLDAYGGDELERQKADEEKIEAFRASVWGA